MLLNKSWSTIFVFVFIYFVNASENESDTESDEDDKLKQALVLVEILKKGKQQYDVYHNLCDFVKRNGVFHAEYLKLLQSQHVVQQQLQQLQQQQPQDLESVTTTVSPPDVNDTTQEVEPENHAAAASKEFPMPQHIYRFFKLYTYSDIVTTYFFTYYKCSL